VAVEHDASRDAADRRVSSAYDRSAERWRATRPLELYPVVARLLDVALDSTPSNARVLDVGCGAGVPVTRALVSRGFRVTGLDFSEELLAIARTEVPAATFVHGDMRTIDSRHIGNDHDLVVAWDSVFHLPRADHATMFARFASWLRPAGRLLLSLGGSAWEGTSEMLGETFFYGGFDPEESLRLLGAAGFSIVHSEIDDPQSRGHLSIVASAQAAGTA
jgi:cyclopropane fatty-acyl-phospholipid synthase-like methyltransferase